MWTCWSGKRDSTPPTLWPQAGRPARLSHFPTLFVAWKLLRTRPLAREPSALAAWNIPLPTGCFCNPGAGEIAEGLSEVDMKAKKSRLVLS